MENDQKIRRFRHDINAHLTAIEQCISDNDMPQLKSYVERMRAETSKLAVQKFTGIGVVDAIISEWYQKAISAQIQWKWDGGMLGQTETDAYDLCVLFSNLLSNAVEAAEQVEETNGRFMFPAVRSVTESASGLPIRAGRIPKSEDGTVPRRAIIRTTDSVC